jgi:hypothetical protein
MAAHTTNFFGEKWKRVQFDFEYANDNILEVSNFGRLRSFNKISNGNILNGSLINGYKIIRLKFFKARTSEAEKNLNKLRQKIVVLSSEIDHLKRTVETEDVSNRSNENYKKQLEDSLSSIDTLKKNLRKNMRRDEKERTIHYHSLVHRLVAEYFCDKATNEHTVVAHLDYDKLNNRNSNLRWMTPKENYIHQQKSPHVIASKGDNKNKRSKSKATKLSITKVMLLKKLLNEGKPMRTLVKNFKITETQILRIKRGENWSDIEAAN